MREEEFREQLRAALGEVPALNGPSLGRSPARPRTHTEVMAVVAGVLAIVMIIALVGSRVMLRPQGNIRPAPAPAASPVAPPPAADSFPCMLPVLTSVQLGDQTTDGMGFINVPNGDYQVDPAATVSDLPHAPGGTPAYYSAALGRWLPTYPSAISPDGTRYAYVTQAGSSSRLHVVDVTPRADRVLWTYPASIGVEAWDAKGILVATMPFAGGVVVLWRIDPATGSASRRPASEQIPTLPPFWALPPGGGAITPVGNDGKGRMVVLFGSRDPGAKVTVVLVDVPAHTETTLYTGVAGSADDFYPETAVFDAHGIWMSGAKRIWLWTASSGLTSFPVTGLPTVPPSIRNNVAFYLKGACVPGTFTGVPASPVAATTPTPSPSSPPVDWSQLLGWPLTLPSVSGGAACPVSAWQQLDVHAQGGKNGPDYGYGQGPAYVSGQDTWYSTGSQGIVVLVDPAYKGPVLVRIRRIDGGSGSVTLTDMGQVLGDGIVGIPQLAPAPYWGVAFGGVSFSAPGCYGIQFDGTGFSDSAVISVVQGPPPPG